MKKTSGLDILLQNVRTQQSLSSMAGIMATVVSLQPDGERRDLVKLSCSILHAVYRAGLSDT
ncbi:hypothetical protein DAPPUDRAFT_269778 [Daphnia pulex]|uniref:Uncharacterized protein n=1 Tax=Daphnia pulex TaxID=6669 RepID=E9HZS4_DAPPU|nr:hypothetical protein DAPPUDRAFT_269778 [Daphnia pulex]|eukprot:EFX62756.1 hypothetical protein DAPPUDRAFT_269778 [Daphnia pulex]